MVHFTPIKQLMCSVTHLPDLVKRIDSNPIDRQ